MKLTRPSWLSGRRVQRAVRCVLGGGSGGGGGVVSVLGGGRPSSGSPHLIVELVWCWCFGLASLVAANLPLPARVGFRVELQSRNLLACAKYTRQASNITVAYTIMGAKGSDKSPKVEKSVKKDKSEKKSKKDKKSSSQQKPNAAAPSLLADKKAVNPALSSLFSAQVCGLYISYLRVFC